MIRSGAFWFFNNASCGLLITFGGIHNFFMENTMMDQNKSDDVSFFLKIGWYEGWSYIILLGIAMPLKYFADMPKAVSAVGSIHGLLFVLFMFAIVRCISQRSITIWQGFLAFLASLIPFGTFFLDRFHFRIKN
jgi:integral membrane protein